jgi:hypothetical protein
VCGCTTPGFFCHLLTQNSYAHTRARTRILTHTHTHTTQHTHTHARTHTHIHTHTHTHISIECRFLARLPATRALQSALCSRPSLAVRVVCARSAPAPESTTRVSTPAHQECLLTCPTRHALFTESARLATGRAPHAGGRRRRSVAPAAQGCDTRALACRSAHPCRTRPTECATPATHSVSTAATTGCLAIARGRPTLGLCWILPRRSVHTLQLRFLLLACFRESSSIACSNVSVTL